MANVKISDAAIREWGRARGYSVGARGRISQELVAAYCQWQETPLLLRVDQLQQELAELRAESNEDKAIIRAQQSRIRQLERDLQAASEEARMWQELATSWSMTVHSED